MLTWSVRAAAVAAVAAGLAGLAAGCLRATELACAIDDDCSGGRCEPDGRCSFADPGCASGWRYGEGAGARAGACVGATDDDGGVDGGADDAATTGDGAIADDIAHVRAEDEYVGTASLTVTVDVLLDTSALTATPGPLPAGVFVAAPQDGGGPELAILRGLDVAIAPGVTVKVVGSRPLVVLARTIVIEGTIDASADGVTPGPGTGDLGSDLGVGGSGRLVDTSDSGGGGGGFGTVGGRGGASCSVAGGAGGAAHGTPALVTLRGGARGGAASSPPGCPTIPGGGAGGALQLYAATAIRLGASGVIHAGGGGGRGAPAPGGTGTCGGNLHAGAGGGSGGALYLQAPVVVNDGLLAANGGGGGSGAGLQGAGMAGADGQPALGAAPGGDPAGPTSGRGGAGGVLTGPGQPAPDLSSNGNGGGGGGGVGRIVIRTRDPGARQGASSPPPDFGTY
ncbi:MAG: hypothetical protein HS111_11905 [Kofleriaceae bacterium]|nr:hypothetical protein [Kofleriaceae bacterium]